MPLTTVDAGLLNSQSQQTWRNRIINGAMVIDQRNNGALVAGATGNIYGVDRTAVGVFGSGTGRISAQQSSTAPTGFTNSLVGTVTTADASPSTYYGYCMVQRIEGYNVADLGFGASGAATVTVSFWVRASITGSYVLTLQNENADRAYSSTYTINSANTWEYKTITVSGDTTGTWYKTTNAGLILYFGLGGGSGRQAPSLNAWNTGIAGGYAITDASGCVDWIATNGATFYLTGLQLEKGSTATSFDYRPYGTELALCQRYALMINSANANGTYNRYVYGECTQTNAFTGNIYFPVLMRAVPSLTVRSTASEYCVYSRITVILCNSIPTIGSDGANLNAVPINGSVASGLTQGSAGSLMSAANQTSFLLFTAEL